LTAAARTKAGFGAGFAILLGVGVSAVLQTLSWEESAQTVAQANQAIQRLEDLSLQSKDAEDWARRYLDTHDPQDLAQCRQNVEQAQKGFGELPALIGPNSSSASNLSRIRNLADRQANTLLRAIGIAQAPGDQPAVRQAVVRQAIESLDRANVSADLRAAVLDVESREQAIVRDNALREQHTATISRFLFALVALISLVLLVAAGSRMSADQKRTRALDEALAWKAEQYRRVVELAGDIIYRTDAEGRFVFCNPAGLTLLHLSNPEVIGRSYLKLIRQDKRRGVERFYIRQFVRRQKNTYYEFPMIDGRGHTRWIGQNVQLVFEGGDNGRIAGFQAIAREITQRRNAEQELKRSRRFVERIAATTPGVLYVYDLTERRAVYSNREIISVLGYKHDDVHQMEAVIQEVIHPDDQAMVAAHHHALRQAQDGEIRRLEFRAQHVDGYWVWLSSRDTPFERGPDGLVKQIVGIAQDVTARKVAQDKLAHRANFDALTGLSSRSYFWKGLQAALRSASIAQTPTAVCLFDIDSFGEFNDRQGHAAGDEILEAVGHIVREELRATDIAGRLGSDEFCIALPGADRDECARVAGRIRERMSSMSFGIASGEPCSIAATFGIAVSDPDGNAKNLMEAADRALFRAKAEGGNRVLVGA
jgi:diguanylate cyclase (GGDEF)-like protein/PAS domain S-box-containing protein